MFLMFTLTKIISLFSIDSLKEWLCVLVVDNSNPHAEGQSWSPGGYSSGICHMSSWKRGEYDSLRPNVLVLSTPLMGVHGVC